MSAPDGVVSAIRDARSILIATHSPMDGDGLGCGLALLRCLTPMGKQVHFITEGNVPRAYAFLAGYEKIHRIDALEALPPVDLVLGLDAGEEARLGRAARERGDTPLVNIDHHVSNPGFGDHAWIDAKAAATGEQVYTLLEDLGAEIDAEAAICLLVALVTDTGRFCYSNTTARTLDTAAALIRHGADPDRLQRRLFAAIPMSMLHLQSRAIEQLEIHADGLVSLLVVRHDFGADLGADAEHLKDLVDLVISVEGTIVGALVRGLPDGSTKVSLRSKSDRADVAEFAASMGGGGHVRAAGFSAPGGPIETARLILPGMEKLAVGAAG